MMIARSISVSARRLAAGTLLAFAALCADADDPPVVTPGAAPPGAFDLSGHFELLMDPDGRLSLADAVSSDAFEPADRRAANVGFTRGAVWARFAVAWPDAPGDSFVLSLGQALVDRVELHAVVDGEVIARHVSGDALPFDRRDVAHRHVNFELPYAPGETIEYYLRASGATSAVALPLAMYPHASFAHDAREHVLLGGYFGVMAALTLTACLLFVFLRQLNFLFFGMYLASYGLVMASFSGYAYQFLWPGDAVLQQRLPTVLIAVTVLSGILMGRRFLDTPRLVPRSEWLYRLVAAAAVTGAVTHLALPGHAGSQIVIASVLVLLPGVLYLGVRCARMGDQVAKYWLTGWLLYVTGVCSVALYTFGWLPHNMLTAYGMYLGSLADFISLSLALSARVWILRSEKAQEVEAVAAELADLNNNLETIVSERTRELERRNRELSELAIRDSLTGLYNHSTSIELLDQLLQQSQRYEFPVATIMVDIDHFKAINDSFGHQIGDRVLEAVAAALTDSVRGADVVGRYGGEEFLIAMPHADALAAREFGERLLRSVREIEIPASQGGSITASIGATVYYPHGAGDSAQEVIQRADEALYRSKAEGRDRFTIESLSLVSGTGGRLRRGPDASDSTSEPVKPA